MVLSAHARQALDRAERAHTQWMKADDSATSVRAANRAEIAFNAATQALFYVIRTDQRTDENAEQK